MPFPAPRPLTPLSQDLVGVRVLVVDDEAIWRQILALDLRQLGYDVVAAGDAEEAVVKAAEARPEVAIIDFMLPEPWDGQALVNRLRREGHDFPVVFFTAFPVEHPLGSADGLVGHVTKAADRAELYDLLLPAVLERRRTRSRTS